jgi:PAS domain S-box-containing protein
LNLDLFECKTLSLVNKKSSNSLFVNNSSFSLPTLLIGIIFLLISHSNCLANEGEPNRILFINSYNPGYKWSSDIEKGLLATFDSSNKNIELSFEYLDSKRFDYQVFDEKIAEIISIKYEEYPFDLVVVSDNAAFSFAMKNREQLFPGLPIVFCGYNNFHPDVLNGKTNITGVNEDMDITELVNTALHLQPKLKKLVFLLSTSETSNKFTCQKFENITYPFFKDKYEIVLLKDLPINQIDSVLSTFSLESALFLLGRPKYAKSKTISPVDNAIMVSAISPIPVYALWDFQLNTGVLGGRVLTGFDQGKAAGNMAIEILNGKSADLIPVMMESPTSTIFDYNTMKRFDIKMKSLPDGCTIINKPKLFSETHKKLFWNTVALLTILVVFIFGLLINLFKQKQTEKKLKRIQKKLEKANNLSRIESNRAQSYLDIADVMFVAIDANGIVTLANKKTLEVLGYEKDEIIGKEWVNKALPEDSRGEVTFLFQNLMSGKSNLQRYYENRVVSKDGEERMIAWHNQLIIKGGQISGILSAGEDITIRKQNEYHLQLSEERFNRVFKYSPSIMILVDLKDRSLLAVNDAYTRIIGYSESEVLNIPNKLGFASKSQEQLEYIINKLNKNDRITDYEFNVRSKSGKELTTLGSAEAFNVREQRLAVFTIIDITAQKLAIEKEELHKEELQQADKMASLGVLVSGVAHEVNNPNNFIMLNTPLIKEAWEQAIPILDDYDKEHGDFELGGISYETMRDTIPSLFDAIEDGTHRIKKIVEDLKNFARKESGNFQTPFNVNDVINDAVALLKSLIKKSTYSFSMNLPDKPIYVVGNKQKLEQVFINLIQNSCESLTSNEESIVIEVKKQDGNCIISVIDEGKGIPKSDIQSITDPFFTSRRDSGGTGLGLSVSAGIIKDHKGKLEFESLVGAGTTARVILPLISKVTTDL